MSDKKIIVPDEIKMSIWNLWEKTKKEDHSDAWGLEEIGSAVCHCISEHPIVPTQQQILDMKKHRHLASASVIGYTDEQYICDEWQRRMFYAPDPGEAKTNEKRTLEEIEVERAEVELEISKARLEEFRISNERLAKKLAEN
jgi:hypothetical protein